MITAVLDHLWQSTLFAGGAGLVTLLLRRNAARARFWLWFAASMKFLVPFAALSALGAALLPRPVAPMLPGLAPIAESFVVPAANSQALAVVATHPMTAAAPAAFDWSALVVTLWVLGTLAIAAHWLSRWLKLRAALSGAVDVSATAAFACAMRLRRWSRACSAFSIR